MGKVSGNNGGKVGVLLEIGSGPSFSELHKMLVKIDALADEFRIKS